MPRPESDINRHGAADGSHPAHGEPPGIAVEHCRAWLEWTATQIDQCLADDKPACDQLLTSLAEVVGQVPPRVPTDSPAGPAQTLNQKMSDVVVAVQSHDRVMQRLAHVAESLRLLHEHLGDARRAQSPESWRVLRDHQMRAFSMADERALFVRMVAHGDGNGPEIVLNPDETIELFAPEHGLGQS